MSCSRITTQRGWWGSNLQPLGLESSTLQLNHCAPRIVSHDVLYQNFTDGSTSLISHSQVRDQGPSCLRLQTIQLTALTCLHVTFSKSNLHRLHFDTTDKPAYRPSSLASVLKHSQNVLSARGYSLAESVPFSMGNILKKIKYSFRFMSPDYSEMTLTQKMSVQWCCHIGCDILIICSLFGGQLSRRSNHQRVARVIYLRSTDRQTVNYYSTIHALELIYFDSNTQEMTKTHLKSSASSNFWRHITVRNYVSGYMLFAHSKLWIIVWYITVF